MYQDYKVGEHKANKGLRIANYFIDLATVVIILIIIITVIYLVLELFAINFSEDNIILDLLMYLGFVGVYFLMEVITKGRSVGKFITGTKVVMIDGSEPLAKNYLIRNLCRLIPFDQLSFLFGGGFHDTISKTTVVNKKAFEADLSQQDSIESLGKTEIE
ncbi:RDD family protein [Algoriella sp.]|uniref:RDD family protein n=1 Tax=Algoriella sp. TaxID=1872434 RepID=UPI002FC9BF08